MNAKKLLVVDDNRLLTRFLTTFLKSKGHEATGITSPTSVMSWLETYSCDGIIMDIGMPVLDGFTLTIMIREKYPTLPIVMFTGLGNDEDAIETSKRIGANGYVSKGLGPSEIYAALMKVFASIENAPAEAKA